MTAQGLGILALLACLSAASTAQQPSAATQTLDEISVAGPQDRERGRGSSIDVSRSNSVAVSLEGTIHVQYGLMKAQQQMVFIRESAARRLPDRDDRFSRINRRMQLELLPDRLVALDKPWMRQAGFELLANVDEADGVPAYIPFGPDVALVNLDYVRLGSSEQLTSIHLNHAMHPRTRQCESFFQIAAVWPPGTNPYILLGNSNGDCKRVSTSREGDLVYAAGVPDELRQAVQQLYDPIASRMSNWLGSEPGNMFVVWRPDSPHDGHRLEVAWARNSLLLLDGADWQRGISAAQREALRVSFMREQIERRVRETDWPGAFTRSAVIYLVLLTRSEDERATRRRLSQELPTWISACADHLQARAGVADGSENVSSVECGLVLQFVYDAVARSGSDGEQNIYDTWRVLLDASFRDGKSGARPAEFLASSAAARRIARGLIEGNMDWKEFAAALADVGVQLRAIAGASPSSFEVVSLEHFQD